MFATMMTTSEYCSAGHPDKVADGIASYLLDRHLERDPKTRFAVEVLIKDNLVVLGGEVTGKADFTEEEIAGFVRDAVNGIGYTREYQKKWGSENAICGDGIDVVSRIGLQSPDISRGVDADGWGDQGIFWGMAVRKPGHGFMPWDWWCAKLLGKTVYESGIGGLDVKTQVTVCHDRIAEVVAAVPDLDGGAESRVRRLAGMLFDGQDDYRLHVNGTGRYVRHSSVGDCGVTGRKLAVDLYGGGCRIGGGSVWGKDATKADVTLNVYARKLALDYLMTHPKEEEVHCQVCCRIGSPEVWGAFYNGRMEALDTYSARVPPARLIEEFGLDKPVFSRLCREGVFTCLDS